MSSVPASPSEPLPIDAAERERRAKVLSLILWVSWIDLLLFVVLMGGGVIGGSQTVVQIFGPIHGIGFLIEVGLIGYGSMEKWWGWWYTVVTVITTGPPGAILGHRKAKRDALGTATA
jgi:hypothetical protein